MRTTLFDRTLFAALLLLFSVGCTTTHHILALPGEAAEYRGAAVRSALLKDGSRVRFDGEGGHFESHSTRDTLNGFVVGYSSGAETAISLRDIMELALEVKEGSAEKSLIWAAWVPLSAIIVLIVVLYFVGPIKFH